MFEVFTHGFTFLNFLSIIAFITTVGLFFCGIPICRQIWKRKDTKEISGAPFLMGILGGTCWMTYGYLKNDKTVMYVTGTQVILYSSYTIFYWFMTKNKLGISLKILFVVSLCASLIASVYYFGHKVFHPLGIVCMTLNTADFAAPLAGLKVVIRRGATSTLPLPLCIANFLVSSEWFLYGLLVWDFYLITPNGIGSVLAFAQILLFVVLPRKPGQRVPIKRLFDCCCRRDRVVDAETAEVVPTEKEKELCGAGLDNLEGGGLEKKNSKSWPKRVITNLEHELENVITKVAAHDQFAYQNDLDSDSSSDDGKKQSNASDSAHVEEIRESERKAREQNNSLREKQHEEARQAKLKRATSSPDLSE